MRSGGCTNPCADQYLVNYRQMQLEGMKQHCFAEKILVGALVSTFATVVKPLHCMIIACTNTMKKDLLSA